MMNIPQFNSISEFPSGKGVFQFDATPIPCYVTKRPTKLTARDKAAILLLARKIRATGKNASKICKMMQTKRELPSVGMTRHWLVKLASQAAKSL